MGNILAIRTLASELMGRAKWTRLAGITFGGKRDLYEVLGYARELSARDYRERYERNEIAARIVEALPRATWRGDGEIVENEDPETETKFEDAWYALDDRLHIWNMFLRADILAGLGRYSVMLIGGPGELSQPLTKCKPEEIQYLTPFAEDDAVVSTWVTDLSDPRFGQPETYQFARIQPSPNRTSQVVHWSRCIHIADGLLDDHVYGKPRLQSIWNRLDDLEKVAGGGAEAFWKRADQGMQLDLDPEIKFTDADKTALADEVEEYIHGLKRIVRTRGVTMNTLGSDVANFGAPIDAIISLLSAGTGIPQRILMGSERGELASTQDKTNWDDRVFDRRHEFAGPLVVRPFIDRMISFSALPTPKSYVVRWPKIDNITEPQRADMAGKLVGLNAAAGDVVILASEIRDRVLKLPPLTETQLAEIQAKKDEAAAAQAAMAAPVAEVEDEEDAEATGLKAAIRSAMAHGRAAMKLKTLRTAVERHDTATVALLLSQANDAVEVNLRKSLKEKRDA